MRKLGVVVIALVATACTANVPPEPAAPSSRPPAPVSATPTSTPAPTATPAPTSTKPGGKQSGKPKHSCEPQAAAKFDPRRPHVITNKDCPEINAARSRSAQEFADCGKQGGAWNVKAQKCTYPARTKAPSPRGVHSSDPAFRDVNGETYAEFCARAGYSGADLENCPAG